MKKIVRFRRVRISVCASKNNTASLRHLSRERSFAFSLAMKANKRRRLRSTLDRQGPQIAVTCGFFDCEVGNQFRCCRFEVEHCGIQCGRKPPLLCGKAHQVAEVAKGQASPLFMGGDEVMQPLCEGGIEASPAISVDFEIQVAAKQGGGEVRIELDGCSMAISGEAVEEVSRDHACRADLAAHVGHAHALDAMADGVCHPAPRELNTASPCDFAKRCPHGLGQVVVTLLGQINKGLPD